MVYKLNDKGLNKARLYIFRKDMKCITDLEYHRFNSISGAGKGSLRGIIIEAQFSIVLYKKGM